MNAFWLVNGMWNIQSQSNISACPIPLLGTPKLLYDIGARLHFLIYGAKYFDLVSSIKAVFELGSPGFGSDHSANCEKLLSLNLFDPSSNPG